IGLSKVVDDSQIAAELQGMLAFGPAEVIHEVVERDLYARGGRLSHWIRNPPGVEKNVALGLPSGLTKSFADVAVTEIVDQGIADDGGVANRQAFPVAGGNRVWRLSGELGTAGCQVIALQVPTEKQAMASIRCQVVVELDDVGIELCRSGVGEGKSSNIQAIADRRIVRQWITVEHRDGRWINPGALRAV